MFRYIQKILLLIVPYLVNAFCFQNNIVDKERFVAKPKGIWAIEWSLDGNYFALGGDDSTLWIYKASDYTLHSTFKLNSMLRGLSWHPKESLLAIANMSGIQMLDLKAKQLTTLPDIKTGGRGIGWNYTGELLALADGRGIVQIMDKRGRLIRSIKKYNNNSYMTVDWHPSKNIIVTGSDEIILFDTSGKQLKLINHRKEKTGVLTVRWHPSGEFFASGDYGHDKEGKPTLLQFWKEDGTLIKEMKGSKAEYRNIRWSNDGSLLATASDALRIWTKDGRLISTGKSNVNLWGVAWSKDNKMIATGSFENGDVKLWTNKAALVKKIH
ncbi:MAG TPA: hypothetical protein VNA26_05755 [Chitinophagaceae bacterium]|nr:hypothetical protein [Chitinophagaceae bacterium]